MSTENLAGDKFEFIAHAAVMGTEILYTFKALHYKIVYATRGVQNFCEAPHFFVKMRPFYMIA